MRYLKQFSIYTFVGFFSAGINFFLMPYISHFIRPEEYGILAMVNAYVTILIPLVGLVASGLIFVEYYRIKDKSEFASLFTSLQLIPALLAILFILISIIFLKPLAELFEIPVEKAYWLPLSVLIAFLTITIETVVNYQVIAQKVFQYTIFVISKVLLEVGLTILFISWFRWSWEGRLLSWLITSILFFFISLIYFKRQGLLTRNVSLKYIRAGIIFGLPLILHTLGKFVINQSDRIFIAKMVPKGLSEAGIYNIGYQVGMVILLLVTAAGNFFQPFLFERLSKLTENAKIQIVKMTYVVIAALALAVILLTLFSPLFFMLVDKDYSGGRQYVFWIALSYFFWGIYILFTCYIFYVKQTKLLGYLAILNMALNLILNYFLIQVFGPLGAAYATCISFLVTAIIVVIKATDIYRLPWFSFWTRSEANPIKAGDEKIKLDE